METLYFTIKTNMPMQLTVVPGRPVQIVLDVQGRRKPQQTALPLIRPHYKSKITSQIFKVIDDLRDWDSL